MHFRLTLLVTVSTLAVPAMTAMAAPHDSEPSSGPPALVVMLRPSPRGCDAMAWRARFAARAHATGLHVRDTLNVRGVPWTLRVLRAEVDGLLLAGASHALPEPAGSRFAGVSRGLADLARRLERDPAVAWAEPDFEREPAHTVDDVLPPEPLLRDTRQWGLWNAGPGSAYDGAARADIHAPEAWRLAGRGASPAGRRAAASSTTPGIAIPRPTASPAILLAVADTGIDPEHPEFADARTGASRIRHARSVADPTASIHDSLGHGTLVAGIMAAAIGEGVHFDSLGMAGVCGDCAIMPLRITRGTRHTASSFDIALAILAATDRGARAVNLSFAGGGRSRLERLALTHAITHGTLVVAASGNRGYNDPGLVMYPAAYAAEGLCLAVGASDMWDHRAKFSTYGPHLDLVAPGLNIWSAWMTYPAPTGATYPGYVAGSGTSFAAPFATGTVGLLAGARPELAADDVRQLLRESADDVGAPGPDAETGRGRLNAAAALAAAGSGIGIWHDEAPATDWRDDGFGTLAIGEDGPGTFAARLSGRPATRVVFTTRITLPDSFADGARVRPRVAGTSTLRPDFAQPWHVPWCDARIEGRSVVLRGYAYRLESGAGEAGAAEGELWIPLPPDQMRFGFTVMGPLKPRPVPAAAPAALHVYPNPARGSVHVETPGAGTMTVFDVRGRAVWRGASSGRATPVEWPGTDALGHPAPPGVYIIRFDDGRTPRSTRLVRLS